MGLRVAQRLMQMESDGIQLHSVSVKQVVSSVMDVQVLLQTLFDSSQMQFESKMQSRAVEYACEQDLSHEPFTIMHIFDEAHCSKVVSSEHVVPHVELSGFHKHVGSVRQSAWSVPYFSLQTELHWPDCNTHELIVPHC